MTQHQNQPQSTDKSNQKQHGNSTPQEVPAPDTAKPAQQPAPQSNKDSKDSNEQASKSPADAASKTTENKSGSNEHKKS